MLFKKAEKLNLLSCDNCKSAGSRGVFRCLECRSMSMGIMAGDTFLYWGKPLTRYHIALRMARRWMNNFRMIGAIVFGFGFFGLFFWSIYSSGSFSDVYTYFYWFDGSDNIRILFWLGVISFSYVFYLVSKSEHFNEIIDDKKNNFTSKKDNSAGKVGMLIDSWRKVKKLSRRKKKDISKVFTKEADQSLERAYRLADLNNNKNVLPTHLFFVLLSSSQINSIFIRLGVSVKSMSSALQYAFRDGNTKGVPELGDELQQVIFQAYNEAVLVGQQYVHLTELLLACVQYSEVIQELLYTIGIDQQKLVNVVTWVRIREQLKFRHDRFRRAAAKRSKHGIDRAMTAVATPYLNQFSQDITLAAKFGYLTPTVAREKEIDEIFRIVEGGRGSIVLVGEHGVGKMAIIEGIAQLMVEDRVPDRIKDKRLVQLSTSALLAGTTVNGAIERLRNLMYEISKAGNVILFINNIHDLISGSGDSEGLDVSEALAEFAGRGAFLTFATTTSEGFNRNIVNSQISSAFAKVDIDVMDDNQAIQVLESKAGGLEYKHKVFFSYDALFQTVRLAGRFLHDQNMPESAISIMVEAAAYARGKRGDNQLVLAEDVASVISEKTGIPTTSISEDESAKLLRLEEAMHMQVIGQDEAVVMVANALRRSRAEIRSTKRPISNFLFLGPTGVGKTELAKTIANVYFGGEERMIRIDMSEFQDKSGIYRLIGQPGQQGTGLLTEAVRQQPFSLVLLDEMEKADPDVLTLFLQVFDDGRLTDSVGRVIDFTNTIIIATSNAGTQYVADEIAKGVDMKDIRDALIRGELKKYYRPEFLNRFDGIILFRQLKKEEIKKIASLMLKRVASDLEKRGVGLDVTEAALSSLSDVGFDPEFGARPMRRAIQEYVENPLAELVLSGKLERKDIVVLGEGVSVSVRRD